MKRVAIVTGASSGVGKEFVRQFDHGKGGPLDEIWIVARSEQRLNEVASSCTKVQVRTFACDLTQAESFSGISQALEEENAEIEWLINSAGFGKFGDYRSVGPEQNANMVRLNCLAVVQSISAVLPYMVSGSRIINLSSIAGAIPQVMLATYSATKAFVLELSRMLDHELKPCGIRVLAVCPKFMKTGFLDQPGDQAAAEGMCRIGYQSVERVVSVALMRAVLGKSLCIPSSDMRLAYVASRIMPRQLLFALEDVLFRS